MRVKEEGEGREDEERELDTIGIEGRVLGRHRERRA